MSQNFSQRSKRKGKGRGGRGNKKYEEKSKRGTGEEGREGSACSHAIVFFLLRLLSHYPIKMKLNWFVCFCFRVNSLTSAHVQDFRHIGRYINIDDKRLEIERK